jgi:hypothetical protein
MKKNINKSEITFGSDPEFGIFFNDKPISGIGLIGGSKKEPMDIGEGCGVQEDNVMAEITIPPVKTKSDFIKYIQYGRKRIAEILHQNTGLEFEIKSISSARYDEEELDNPVAKLFGCEPSYCIYTKSVSPRPTPEEIGNLRSAGFHIHCGIPKLLSMKDRVHFIFCMDIMLGVPSIIIDTDEDRRKLYGNAGDFRAKLFSEKDYTIIEYRTLGGAMHASDELIGWCYDQTNKAIDLFLSTESVDEILKENDVLFEEIKKAIDDGDIDLCKNLVKTFKIELPVTEKIYEYV